MAMISARRRFTVLHAIRPGHESRCAFEDAAGNATVIRSPSWAGAYPWIDRTMGVYGVMLVHVDVERAKRDDFLPFYTSPILVTMVRDKIRSLSR
jgi:hypothetical protein